MQDLQFEQNLEQTLHMTLSPRLLGMLHILSLPYTEIVAEIEKASEENPFLEIEKHDSLVEYLKCLGQDKKIRKEVDFKEYPGLENVKECKKSLRDFLIDQINLIELPEIEVKIAQALVDSLDGNGYIKNYEEIKQKLIEKLKVDADEIDETLITLQTLEPEGVFARDLKECLLIQVNEYGFDSIELQEIIGKAIKNHLEDIGNKKFGLIAKSLNISAEAVQQIVEFIKNNLNPYPASDFVEAERGVVPSFVIEKDKGHLKWVNLEEKYGPKLIMSKEYQKMLKNPKTDAETLKFLKDKFEKAKEVLENLEKRGETSEAIVKIITDVQKEYFEKGVESLMPLEQKELANKLGLHPSTISRAVSGKYIQTPNGLLPMKFLCPRQFKGFSPASIKSKIIEMVKNENKKDPMADDDIRDKLLEDGINIARRTISSYRKQLHILPASERANP